MNNREVRVIEAWPGATPKNYRVSKVPNKIICTSTTHLHFLELLGLEDKLVGFPNTRLIYSPQFNERVEKGSIRDLGPDGNINIELVIALQPDLVIAFDAGNDSRYLKQIEDAGIPVILNADYMETSALGRAEWIKFFGWIFQQEEKADSIFQSIAMNYMENRDLILDKQLPKPEIMSGTVYGDKWFLPGGKNWFAKFFEDAGGEYLWKENNNEGWLELDIEAIVDTGIGADVWIGTGGFYTKSDMLSAEERYQTFEAFKASEVYNYGKRIIPNGGNDFFESGYARPDIVLMDLIRILHPQLLPHYETRYFLKLQ